MEDKVFNKEFYEKLKSYYSVERGHRRSGRSVNFAKVLLETAIETNKVVCIIDHNITGGNPRETENRMADLVRTVANQYRHEGVNIAVNYNQMNGTFIASINPNDISSVRNYMNIRIRDCERNMFPVDELKARLEFLKRRKLLLLK